MKRECGNIGTKWDLPVRAIYWSQPGHWNYPKPNSTHLLNGSTLDIGGLWLFSIFLLQARGWDFVLIAQSPPCVVQVIWCLSVNVERNTATVSLFPALPHNYSSIICPCLLTSSLPLLESDPLPPLQKHWPWTPQVHFRLRAFVLAVASAWKLFLQIFSWALPSTYSVSPSY